MWGGVRLGGRLKTRPGVLVLVDLARAVRRTDGCATFATSFKKCMSMGCAKANFGELGLDIPLFVGARAAPPWWVHDPETLFGDTYRRCARSAEA